MAKFCRVPVSVDPYALAQIPSLPLYLFTSFYKNFSIWWHMADVKP